MSDNHNHQEKNGICNEGRISGGFEDGRRNKFDNHSQRLSQKEEVGRSRGGSRNVAVTEFLRGYEKSDFQKQEERLFEFARKNNCWFDIESIEQEFGSEIFDKLKEVYGAKGTEPTETEIYNEMTQRGFSQDYIEDTTYKSS